MAISWSKCPVPGRLRGCCSENGPLCGVQSDPQSEALKLSDRPAADLLFAASSERPRSGIAVGSAGGEHAPARDEDLVGDGHNGFVFALPSGDPPEELRQVRVLGVGRRVGALDEGGPQKLRALAGPGGLAFARGFALAGAEA